MPGIKGKLFSFLFHIHNGLVQQTALIMLAFGGSIGMSLVILSCAFPMYKVWWPFFVVLFYILAPIPTMIARRYVNGIGGSVNACMELAIFITMCLVVSSFALPIVLARSPANDPVIQWGACSLTLAGNVIMYLTLIGFFTTSDQNEIDYISNI